MKKLLLMFFTAIIIYSTLAAQNQWSTFSIKRTLDSLNLPETFKAEMQLRWDADSIYLNMFVKDTVIFISPENRYTGDNIEVYFDMENLKTPTMPRGTTPYPPLYRGEVGTYQFRLVPDTAFYSDCFIEDDNYRVNGIRQVYTKTDSGYQYSLAFPLDSLMPGHTFTTGDTIGFDVLISNNDGGDEPYRNQISWNAPNTGMWSDVCQWGTLILEENGTFSRGVIDTIPPTKPSNFQVEVNDNEAYFTWDPSTDNTVVDLYFIVRDTIIDGKKGMMGYGGYALESDNSYTISNLKTDTTYIFKLLAIDVYMNISEFSDSLIVRIPSVPSVNINNNSIEPFSLYPNPASDILNIKNSETINTVEILSLTGQIVEKQQIQSTTAKLNISNLKGGIYILKAYTSEGIISRQFVK